MTMNLRVDGEADALHLRLDDSAVARRGISG